MKEKNILEERGMFDSLITFGFIAMLIVGAVVLLFYFNILDFQDITGEKVSISPPLTVKSFGAFSVGSSASVKVEIVNVLKSDIEVVSFKVIPLSPSEVNCEITPVNEIVKKDSTKTVQTICDNLSKNEWLKANFEINYKLSNSGLENKASGYIKVKAE